ncbi:MAG: SLC45 family MFS transporter [Bacillota bacterium]
MRLNYGKTFTLGLGFFTISVVWQIYNSYMPVFYSQFVTSTALVGFLMTIDNILALTLQPIVGSLSDRTWTRFGRRLPYLLIGMPVAALFFILIPFTTGALVPLLVTSILVNLAMASFRSPTIALMPDVTPSPLRSQANGIINLMGGVGFIIGAFGLSRLYRLAHFWPYLIASLFLVVVPLILLRAIKEPRESSGKAHEEFSLIAATREVLAGREKSALYLLLAIFFWFVGYNGVEALFTKYGISVLGIDEADGALTLGFISLTFLIFALPAGYIAARLGRKRTILTGIVVLTLLFVALASTRNVALLKVLFLVAGFFWAMININSYPMVADMAGADNTGAYTSLYYVFSSLAAIAGPPLFGFLMDRFGYGTMFYWSALFFVVAFLAMTRVRRGEARTAAAPAQTVSAD